MAARRTTSISKTEIRQRAETAREHLQIAEMELEEALRRGGVSANAQVAATSAIDAAIAASDAICGAKLGERSAEQDHKVAATLLERIEPGGKALATKFSRVVSDKTKLSYGGWPTAANVAGIVKAARELVNAIDTHV